MVVLSYPTWKKRFGGDPNIVGRKITLNQQPYEIIGVMGPEFGWPNQAEVWTPLALDSRPACTTTNYRYNEYLFVVGRMTSRRQHRAGQSISGVKARENANSEGEQSYAKISGWGMFSMPLLEYVAGDLRKPLSVLLGAVDSGVADRVRQHRRAATGARLRPAARNLHPHCAGRRAQQVAGPGLHRERSAVGIRQSLSDWSWRKATIPLAADAGS